MTEAPTKIWLHKEDLDGPWINATWSGDEIDSADVPYVPAALLDEAVEALKRCDEYFTERANPGPDLILRRRLREEAESAARAVISRLSTEGESK